MNVIWIKEYWGRQKARNSSTHHKRSFEKRLWKDLVMAIKIRSLTSTDSAEAVQVFFDAIHVGTADVYSEKERIAWAGNEPDTDGWRGRFDNVDGLVAETDGKMLGFMTLDQAGYIDLAFVAPDAMGQGIGRQLYEAIERRAIAARTRRLTTEASMKAKPFFERMGWQVEREQIVVKRNTPLTNFRMYKSLAQA